MAVAIRQLADLAPAARFEALRGIDQIFFEASSVQAFASGAARFAFHWLWLGRYLIEEPGEVFIAEEAGRIEGYLVGSLADPAPRPAFQSLDYFKAFARETARYPAHLHINVRAPARGGGIGEQLIRAFEAHATRAGALGVHVVTGAGLRNVAFYERLGFREVARTARGAGHVVMLAKALGPHPS